MSSFQNLLEKIFGVLTLLFYTGALEPFIRSGNPLVPLMPVLPHVAAVITLALLLLRWKRTLLTMIRVPLLWLLMAIAVASPFWSSVPADTWGEVVPLVRVTLFSLYLASRYSLKEILALAGWALGSAAALSVIFGALLPTYGVMGKGQIVQSQDWVHEGAWRGVFIHKTVLGSVMALAIMVCLYLTSWKNVLRPLALFTLPLATLALLMSTTKAALVILVGVLLCIPLYRVLRWNPRQLALCLGIGLPLVVLIGSGIVGNFEDLLAGIGRNTTLSGRTLIWPLVLENIRLHPWFGYGYNTFWLHGWEGDAAVLWSQLPRGFEPPHAHNAYLDVLLSFGWVGFAVFMGNLAAFGYRACRWIRTCPTAEGMAPLMLFVFMLLVNITESKWITPNIFWVGYVTMAIAIAQKQQQFSYFELFPVPSQAPDEGTLIFPDSRPSPNGSSGDFPGDSWPRPTG
ncbi:MAG: O-antigen ligase [Cyanobacteria bacterium J06597_16]